MMDQWIIRWCKGGTEMVEEWNMSLWNRRTPEISGRVENHVMVEKWNSDGGIGEQKLWNNRTEMVE